MAKLPQPTTIMVETTFTDAAGPVATAPLQVVEPPPVALALKMVRQGKRMVVGNKGRDRFGDLEYIVILLVSIEYWGLECGLVCQAATTNRQETHIYNQNLETYTNAPPDGS